MFRLGGSRMRRIFAVEMEKQRGGNHLLRNKGETMSAHKTHDNHPHVHGEGCGHAAIIHNDHVDYLHDGHLHRPHEGHVDECVLEVSKANPSICTPSHHCSGHEAGHVHGENCGHPAVRTEITWIIWWMGTCIIRMVIIVTITGPWCWRLSFSGLRRGRHARRADGFCACACPCIS